MLVRSSLVAALSALLSLGVALAQSVPFLDTFDGTPTSPQPYQNPRNWDIFAQGYNRLAGDYNVAQHGPNCEPPGFPYSPTNSHVIHGVEDMVFLCGSGNGTHLMTASGLSGYAAVYMSPPALMDYSQGPSTLSFDVSTLRTSSRDWWDIVLTPWSDYNLLAWNNSDQHIPANAVHVELVVPNTFVISQRVANGPIVRVPSDSSTTWNTVLAAHGLSESPSRRDTFQVTVTNSTISLCMPQYDFCWANQAPLPTSIAGWGGHAVVQINHRSYNPEKGCIEDPNPFMNAMHSDIGDQQCPPNTWHWDNVSVEPHTPYTYVKASPNAIETASATRVQLAQPTPANSYLEFQCLCDHTRQQVSWDGSTWQDVQWQGGTISDENGNVVFMPIPQGVSAVWLRGANGYWGSYLANGIGVRSSDIPAVIAVPTATPTTVPTNTPTPVSTSTPTAVPTNTPLPTVTPTVSACEVNVRISGTEYGWRPC